MLLFVSLSLLFPLVMSSITCYVKYERQCNCYCTCSMQEGRLQCDCGQRSVSAVPDILPDEISSLNLSFNHISTIDSLKQYKYLKFLDVSHNNLKLLTNQSFPSLRHINISYNFLSNNFISFVGMVNLEVLDLSGNRIQVLETEVFKNLKNLRILNVSNNGISSWNVDMKTIPLLQTLDISQNKLMEVPEKIRLFISKNLCVFTNLSLKSNLLKCTCDTIGSFKWILANKHHVGDYKALTCQTEDHFYRSENFDKVLIQLNTICTSYVGTMFGILSASMLCIGLMIAGLVYKYRWKLRYLYYAARMRHRGYAPLKDEDEFDYDAFISYADEDRELVVGEMRRRLEDTRGLKLCIHHRDFLPGNYIADNILNAVKTSRKTVLMLSKNFLKSKWCKYEAEMARIENIYTERKIRLIVVLENIPLKDLNSDIVELMHSESYVEYTDDVEGREVFWDALYRGITAS